MTSLADDLVCGAKEGGPQPLWDHASSALEALGCRCSRSSRRRAHHQIIGAVDEAARLRGDELVRKSQGAVERFVESLSRRRPLFVAFPNENRFPYLPELLAAAPTKVDRLWISAMGVVGESGASRASPPLSGKSA